MKNLLVALASITSLALAACGPDSSPSGTNNTGGTTGTAAKRDNVKACKEFYQSLSCGSLFDPSLYTASCDSLSTQTCDLSAYFDCLRSGFSCVSGTPDVSGWSACVSKATCK